MKNIVANVPNCVNEFLLKFVGIIFVLSSIFKWIGLRSFAYTANDFCGLLMANVEAMSSREEGDTYIPEKCYYESRSNGQAYAFICKKGTTSNGYKDCDVVERVDRYSQSSWCIKIKRD